MVNPHAAVLDYPREPCTGLIHLVLSPFPSYVWDDLVYLMLPPAPP